jgi:hypothetical protein
MSTYKIFFASGDQLRDRDGKSVFTAAEAAERVSAHPLAEMDPDGDIIVSTYRNRNPGHRQVSGTQMAARLRRA